MKKKVQCIETKEKKQVLSYLQLSNTIFQSIFSYFSIKNNWNQHLSFLSIVFKVY